MTIKELIKKLKKYPNDYLVRLSIGESFWCQDGFVDHKGKDMKLSKNIKERIDHNLFIPNYLVDDIEDTSVDCGREITLHGRY